MNFVEGFTIRCIEPGDLDGVVDLAADAGEAPRWGREEYEQIMLTKGPLLRCGLVALWSDQLSGVAVVSYLPLESAAELEGLAVDPAYRRRGMGKALVEACVAWAAKAGASAIRLEVRASNSAAIALYRQQGFSVTDTRRDYYSAPQEDALLLETALEGGLPL